MMTAQTGQKSGNSRSIDSSPLELLFSISRDLASTLDLHTLLSSVLSLAVKNVNAERGTFVVLDERLQPVDAAIVYGGRVIPHKVDRILDILEKGLMGWVQQNRRAALIPDTSRDERWLLHDDDSRKRSGAKSAVCAPLVAHDQLVGVLTIVHSQPGFFTRAHMDLLQSIADQAAIAVKNSLLFSSLQAARNRYHELFEDYIDPILITDRNGCIIEANRQAAQTMHISPEAILQHSITDLLGMESQQVDDHYRELNDQNNLAFESEVRLPAGDVLPVEVFIKKNSFEGQDQYQWILRDISERKAYNNMRKDLAAMIYHDINNPLSNIFTSLDLVSAAIAQQKDPNLSAVLNIFRRSAERMQRLINSLLDIERLEAGQPITNRTEADIHGLVSDAIDAITPTFEAKGQSIHVEIPSALPPLLIDVDMIRRVIINLLENASKFSPAGGSIWIGGNVGDHLLELWVEDEGPGIPRGAGESIFDKYTQIGDNHQAKGIGLGLAFCRLAVRAHGGDIRVEQRKPRGSRFVVSLPIKPG